MLTGAISAQSLAVGELRCEYHNDPFGIDVLQPRLSWQLQSDGRDVVQMAYHIRAAEAPEDLEKGRRLLWDSGRINASQSIYVPYGGLSLSSRQRVYWQVRVWDNHGNDSGWSEPAWWEMGLLEPADWQAQWIEPDWEVDTSESPPSSMLRREFNLSKSIISARLYITSHGLYEAQVNGQRVGDQVFTPGWTSYNKRLQYQTYDVTELLQRGDNAIGVRLGDGWYRGWIGWSFQRNYYGKRLGLLAQLEVTYRDGSRAIITSDDQWRVATGPIRLSDIYNGEQYDARLEQAGWATAGFEGKDWASVRVADHLKDHLLAPIGPPVRKTQELQPVQIFETPAGETVVDFGQNMVGWVRLRVEGKAGTTITLQHAEVLDKEGNFYTENLRSADQKVIYTLKGGGEEIYEPHFTFFGFRYVKVDGWPGELTPANLTGVVIHSDMDPAGSFECSNELINQLQQNIRWGQRGNFLDVPTDCPQRDERMGWTGDAQAFARTAAFNFHVAGFFRKWLADLEADQRDDGAVPHVIPHVLGKDHYASAGWADAVTIVPWNMYLVYGDTAFLKKQYDSMKAWVGHMEQAAGEEVLWNTGFHFGDWLFYSIKDDRDGLSAITDKYLIAQAFFVHSADLLRQSAEVLGKATDAAYYRGLARRARVAFQDEFVTANGRLISGTQTAYVLALSFDLLPEALRPQAAQRLADNVRSYGHLTTGFLGTPYLCHVLTDYGYEDLAFQLLERTKYPSWLYPVTRGATTIWERWDGIRTDSSFQEASMNSFNHYAYGAIGDWLYRRVAGIDLDKEQAGYKHIWLRPLPGGELTYARASHESPYGKVASGWKLSENRLEVSVTIPPNTTATLRLPGAAGAEVQTDPEQQETSPGTGKSRTEGADLLLNLGSGRYRFTYPWKKKM